MSKDYYRVVCENVNLILLVHKLSKEQASETYNKVVASILGMKKPVPVDHYKEMLIGLFLFNSKDLLASLPSEAEEREVVLHSIYTSVLEVYPEFDLRYLCSGINGLDPLKDISELMENMFDTTMTMGPPKSKSTEEQSSKGSKDKILKSIGDINKLERHLRRNIIGQDQAIESIVENIKLIVSGLYKSSSFFFIGPTGVGKTEISKLLGEKYSGNFWKINCAEYANSHEYAKLIGSPPGYVGHNENSLMFEKSEKSSRWVILFDEIEKGHHKFYDFLLSLLDDGTCTDNVGRVLDFSESIFIFTSNQGVSDLNTGRKIGFDKSNVSVSSCEHEITESVKKKFPAEFMNRIDSYIFFNQLSKEDIRKISNIALGELPIKRHKCLLNYVTDNGYSEEYGARNLNRFIKNNVATKIAERLLSNTLPNKKGDLYTPVVKNNELFITDLSEKTMTNPAV